MKFSVFAGLATLALGVFAAPQPEAQAVHVSTSHALDKRVDLTSAVSSLQTEVQHVLALTSTLTDLLNVAAAGNVSVTARITANLAELNSTLTNITGLVSGLGLGDILSGVTSTVSGLLKTVTGALSSVVTPLTNAVTGLLGSLLGGLSKREAPVAVPRDASLSDITSSLTALTAIAKIVSLLGTVVTSVGSIVSAVTSALDLGQLGDVSSLGGITEGTATTAQTELSSLIATITSLLNNLLGSL